MNVTRLACAGNRRVFRSAILMGIAGAIVMLGQGRPAAQDNALAVGMMELREELDRLSPGGGAWSPEPPAETMLSHRRAAVVRVGGEFRTTYAGVRSEFVDPGRPDPFANHPAAGTTSTGGFEINRVRMHVDVKFNDRWRAFMGFNLISQSRNHSVRGTRLLPGGGYAREDGRSGEFSELDETYIEYMKPGHSGFSFKAGFLDIPFGIEARPRLYPDSFFDAPDMTGSFLMNPAARNDSVRMPHASLFLDPVMAALVRYEMRDIVRFDAALFQDNDGRRTGGESPYGGPDYRRTGDPGFRSYALRASFLPLEGWELSVAFRNRHNRFGNVKYWSDSPYRSDFSAGRAAGAVDPWWDGTLGQWVNSPAGGERFGAVKNEMALVAGFALEIPGTKLSVFAEYAHGWRQGFNRHVSSDGLNAGFSYRLTPRLTLHGQGEWLYVADGSWMVRSPDGGWMRDRRGNHLRRYLVALEYEVAKGLILEGGWQYERWDFVSAAGDPGLGRSRMKLKAGLGYVGARFAF